MTKPLCLARLPWMSFTTLGMSGLASAVRGRSADQKPRRPSGASERQGRDAVAGPGARIPSDSRHLLGLGQALLRRGKQMSGRTHGEPRATRLLMGSPPAQTPALLWCRCSGHGGLRSSATSANDRLQILCRSVKIAQICDPSGFGDGSLARSARGPDRRVGAAGLAFGLSVRLPRGQRP